MDSIFRVSDSTVLTHGIELLLGRILVIGINRVLLSKWSYGISGRTTTPPLIGGTIRFGDIQFYP